MSDPAIDHLRAALHHLRQTPERSTAVAAAELALALADPQVEFGELLHQRRTAARFSVADLSTRTGLSENTLRNLEAGRTTPAPDSLKRLLAVTELQLGAAEPSSPSESSPREYRPNAHLTQRYDPTGMAQDLRALVNGPGGTLEQSHLYLDNQSAADYLAVCEAYGSLRSRLFEELQVVASLIDAPPVDVVAIGSGDGRAEVCLTRALAMRGRCARLYLLDISHSLLTRAYEHAALVLQPQGVAVEAVHGNFHELQRYPMLHGGPGKPARLYTLLGATVANLTDELRFFRDLHSCSAPGDFALIDYQIAHDPPEQDLTLGAGAVPKIFFDWHAGPLRRNNHDVRNVSFGVQMAPGHLPGSYLLVSVATATMADRSARTYRVMSSSRYTTATLSAALAGAGWNTVHSVAYEQRTAVMLLRRG